MRFKILIITILFLQSGYWLAAQDVNYKFRSINVDHGLSHTDVTSTGQDESGFIWLGTSGGLNRFDGFEIKSYTIEYDRKRRGYLNRINDLQIDEKEGLIWLVTEGGLACFNFITEQFVDLDSRMLKDPFFQSDIKSVLKVENDIYLASETGFRVLSFNNGMLKKEDLKVFRPYQNKSTRSLKADRFNNIWFLSAGRLICYDRTENNLKEKYITGSDGRQWRYFSNYSLQADKLYAITNNGVVISADSTGNFTMGEFFPLHFDQVFKEFDVAGSNLADLGTPSFTVGKDKELWIGTKFGLIRFDAHSLPQYSEYSYYYRDVSTGNDAKTFRVSNLFIDRSNVLWVATYGQGINFTDLYQKKFHLLQRNNGNPQGNTLSGNYIRAVVEDKKGNLWIGTQDEGLNYYEFSTDTYLSYKFIPGSSNTISSNEIRSLLLDTSGRLWIGTVDGVDVFDLRTGKITSLVMAGDAKQVFSMVEDSYGQIWAASWVGGLLKITETDTGSFEVSDVTEFKYNGNLFRIEAGRLTFLTRGSSENQLFLGSNMGLYEITLDDTGNPKSLQTFFSGQNSETSLSSDFVWPLVVENDSSMWLGTIGGGLNHIKVGARGSYTVEAITEKDGLPSDDVETILQHKNDIWIGSYGLTRYNKESYRIINYDANDGLQGNIFKIGAAHKGRSGRFYFGGTSGITYFYPDSIKDYPLTVNPVLSTLSVNNREMLVNEEASKWPVLKIRIMNTDTIRLSYLDNNFSIKFSSDYYGNPNRIAYRYKLEGFDEEWIYTDKDNRMATYVNLDYGHYLFNLQVSLEPGVWETKPRKVWIEIVAPWWVTRLAKTIYLIVIISTIVLIFFLQRRWFKLKKQFEITKLEEKQKEELHQVRMQFFTNISHEFRTPLTLIKSPLQQLSKGDLPKDKVKYYHDLIDKNANRLMSLVNELMYFRKSESGMLQLKLETGDLNSFLQDLSENFEEVAIQRNIDFQFTSGKKTRPLRFDKKVLEKIIFNLINNAFKYSSEGDRIEIKVLEKISYYQPPFKSRAGYEKGIGFENYQWITVRDTGVGISEQDIHSIFDRYFRVAEQSANAMGSGIGLALTRSLVKLHLGKIFVSSQFGEGTEFVIGIPFSANAEFAEPAVQPAQESGTGSVFMEEDELRVDKVFDFREEKVIDTRKLILVVDDNEGIRKYLYSLFTDHYRVAEAENGEEAMSFLEKEKPDLIISDLMMPKLDGTNFCAQVNDNLSYCHIPFIILTAKSSEEYKVEHVKLGADAYFCKPFNGDLLVHTVNNMIESRENYRKLYSSHSFEEARKLALNDMDRKLMDQLLEIIEDHISNPDFDVDQLCKLMGMSRTKLYNKVNDITSQPLGILIRTIRVRRAARILASENVSVTDVTYRVGMLSRSYFSKCFKKEYGVTPSEFLEEINLKSKE